MIARRYRFHGYNALRFVYKQGRTVRGNGCMMRYVPNPRQTNHRIAVVVGKKVSKSAVIRNRIRRRLYAAIQAEMAETSAEASRGGEGAAYDLVFTVTSIALAVETEKNINNIIKNFLQVIVKRPVDN